MYPFSRDIIAILLSSFAIVLRPAFLRSIAKAFYLRFEALKDRLVQCCVHHPTCTGILAKSAAMVLRQPSPIGF